MLHIFLNSREKGVNSVEMPLLVCQVVYFLVYKYHEVIDFRWLLTSKLYVFGKFKKSTLSGES